MKRNITMLFLMGILAIPAMVDGCASRPPQADDTPPPPERLYGTGTALEENGNMSLTLATMRARARIAFSFFNAVNSAEGAAESGKYTITLRGAEIESIEIMPDGTFKAVVSADKEEMLNANREYAVNASKLPGVPAPAADSSEGIFTLPENITELGPVSFTRENNDAGYDAVLFGTAFLMDAAESGGNGVISIDGTSGTAVLISNNNFASLFNAVPKSPGKLYGIGLAQMAEDRISVETAATRARTEIARSFASVITIEKITTEEGNETLTSASTNALVKGAVIEHIAKTPDGAVWIIMSVDKELMADANRENAEEE